jgi:hypothetical protein
VVSCSSRDWHKSSCEMLNWTSSPLSFKTSSSRCLRVACAPFKRGALLLEPTQRLLSCQAFPLKCSPDLGESSPLLLKLGLRLLARGLLLTELLLRRGEHGGLVRQGRLQPLGLLGLFLGLSLPGPRPSRAAWSCWSWARAEATSASHSAATVRAPARSSCALCSASSRSTSAVFTLSTAETSSAT